MTTPTRTAFQGATRATGYIEAEPPTSRATKTETPVEEAAETITPELVAEPVTVTPSVTPVENAEAVVPVDLATLSTTVDAPRAQRGVRGVLGKLGLPVAPGATEQAELAEAEELRRYERTIRQATWSRAVSVLVANPKGGSGKTPTALALGGVLAAIRGGSVCIVEVSDDIGALAYRSEGAPARGLGELVLDADTIHTAGHLTGYTAPQSSFAAVIGSVGSRPPLDREAVQRAVGVIDDHFAIRVMDSGNQPSSAAFEAALEAADVLVVPTYDAGDSALAALALLEQLTAVGGRRAELARHATIVRLDDGRPHNADVAAEVHRLLDGYGSRERRAVPYDAHIAERGQLTLERLARPTYRAFAGLAADVVQTLQTSVR